MPLLEFSGKSVEVDEDGYLINLDDWTKELGEFMVHADGMNLTEDTGKLSTS